MKFILAGIIAVAIPAVAAAHSWYPQECCHDEECVPVTAIDRLPGKPYQIWHTEKFGPVQVDETVIRDRSGISEDGLYHLCAVPREKRSSDTDRPLAKKQLSPDRWYVRCVFVPGVA